jgi:NitT/TauT family transport system substrate-binding protein
VNNYVAYATTSFSFLAYNRVTKKERGKPEMKKAIALILSILILTFAFAGCQVKAPETKTEEYTPVSIRLGGLKGPTSMGMVKLLDDAENKKTANEYEFTMAAAADELTPKLLKGEIDIVSVPANLGSVLYNNSDGAVQAIAVSTLGVIYIVEKGGETIQSLEDLKGQTIYATGKGTTPEYALQYLLAQSGLDSEKDVTIEWKSEPTEVVAQMATMDHAIAMMPQPFVTVASNQLENLRIAIDLTKVWDDLDNGSRFITAALIARTDFVKENPEAVAKFLEE